MNSRLFFLILLVLGGAVIFDLSVKSKTTQDPTNITPPETSSQTPTTKAQTKSMGAVEVEVTPKTLARGKEAIFQFSLNTHSVDLNYDLTQIITLTDNLGKNYKALKWSGGSGGHHLSGQLVFESLSADVQTVTANIDSIDNQSTSFTWNL